MSTKPRKKQSSRMAGKDLKEAERLTLLQELEELKKQYERKIASGRGKQKKRSRKK